MEGVYEDQGAGSRGVYNLSSSELSASLSSLSSSDTSCRRSKDDCEGPIDSNRAGKP